MGVDAMSLINQMLQDLDARRSESAGGSQFGQQVRTVSPGNGRRIHPAWWALLGAAGVAAVTLVILLVRPQAFFNAPQASSRPMQASPAKQAPVDVPRLPLRIDSDLGGNSGTPIFGAPAFTPAPQGGNPQDAAAAAREPSPVPSRPSAPAALPQPAVPAQEEKPEPKAAAAPRVDPRTASSALPSAELPSAAPVPRNTQPSSVPELPREAAKLVKEMSPQQRAENVYRRALTLIDQGRNVDAAPLLEESLRLDQRHAGARQTLIGILLDQKRIEDATRLAREGLSADPAQLNLAMILARLQVEQSELRPAIETLERTLPHAGDRADYLAFLAALLQRDERHKQAVDLYGRALQRSPQNGIWWMGMGISLQADQRRQEAAEAFRRARSSGSLSPELLAFVDSRLAQLR